MATHRKLFRCVDLKLLPMNNSEPMKTFLRITAIFLLAGWTNLLSAFTYSDSDLLLVFRKSGYNDVLFNLGSVSNYLGQPIGTPATITNYDFSRVQANFGPDLTGVKYVLAAVTSSDDPVSRTWLSDSAPSGLPNDETHSLWTQQHGKINAVGSRATSYPEATNQ